ncbi:phage major capsid protein, partial [Limosilactobacillus reuteri]|uniref:phage major capsid protein n=1 Tax=Limosilactobacillus reuteri TaxID=1598 RepID=UPI00146B281C
ALKFNTPSKPLGNSDSPFTEVIDPHALDDVDLSNVYMLNDHDFTQVLASTKAGTLKLNVDNVGLHFEATLPDTTLANDVLTNIQAGNTTDTSFGFVVASDGDTFTQNDDGSVTRTINQVKSLFDVSICAIGAYSLGDDAVQVNTRSYDKWLSNQNKKNKKEEKRSMTEKTIIKPTEKQEDIEKRSFEDYLRSAGERRDLQGLTTDNVGKVVVPQEISKPILELTQDKPTLANYITRRQVSSSSGILPVATRQNGILQTKKELAEVQGIGVQLLQGVDYKLATRMGKVYISEEEMEDSVFDLTSTIQAQLQQLITNTDNANIINVLTTDGNFQTASANLTSNLDDIKKVKNTMLDPQLDVQVVMSSTDFNTLDTMKDEKGDYLLQPSVTSPTGKSLLGMDVIQMSDSLMPVGKMFVGSLAESVLEAYKGDITAQWQQFDYYAQGFLAGIRSDYEPIAKESGVLVTIGGSSASASTPAGK